MFKPGVINSKNLLTFYSTIWGSNKDIVGRPVILYGIDGVIFQFWELEYRGLRTNTTRTVIIIKNV